MRFHSTFFIVVVAAYLLFLSAIVVTAEEASSNDNDGSSDDTDRPKRLGRKKKIVEGKVYASYGLSPHAVTPERTVSYSKAAVSAASSAAAAKGFQKVAASAAPSPEGGGEPPAPGCQAKVDLRPYMSAIEDQAQSNSCAANAVAGAYEYLATRAALRDGEDTVGDVSRLFIYYVGRKRDQQRWGENAALLPKDEGMTLGSAIEAVQLKGAALQATWPFDLSRVNTPPLREAFDEAMRYKVGDAMDVPLDLDKMRQCLNDGYPIIFGLKLTRAFFTPPYDGFIPTPDPSDPKSASHGNHAMLIVGYNDRQRVFIVRNSWGTRWGVDGYCYLSYDYVCNPAFNFVGQFAIQSLTDDDLTPDEDDGVDLEEAIDPLNQTPHIDIAFDDHFDLIEEGDLEDDLDADDMFDSKAEARRAFVQFAGDVDDMSVDNLLISKDELRAALLLMGVPMVTEEELDSALGMYDDDKSGHINFEEFLDMQDLFDGSLLKRQRKITKLKKSLGLLMKKTKKFLFGSSTSSTTNPQEL